MINLIYIVYVLNAIIAIYLIFFDSKTPSATMAWILIMFMLPYLGLILYLLFSQNIARRKIYKVTDSLNSIKNEIIGYQESLFGDKSYHNKNRVVDKWRDLVILNLNYSDGILSYNKEINTFFDGKEMFDALCEDIKNAKYSIKIQCFIIKDDVVGDKFIKILTEKAREGLKVKLLLDAMGSRGITERKLSEFKEAGGEYAFFFKPLFRYIMLNFNYRNHRKMAIIDNEKAYIGGFNIAKEYLGLKKKFGYWRDTHISIKGNALVAMTTLFYLDWNCATKNSLSDDDYKTSLQHAFKSEPGNIPAQIIWSGPSSNKEEIKTAMIKMISSAKENIFIQTPYLVPDESMIETIRIAARSGIDVNIMIPSIPDHPFVYRTTLYNAGRLLNEGVKIHIYENGFLHAKTLVVDDEVTTVGSCNMDIRSFKLNFEANAIIYDSDIARKFNEQYRKDLEYCRDYTLEDRANIGLYERITESVSRLLAEIL